VTPARLTTASVVVGLAGALTFAAALLPVDLGVADTPIGGDSRATVTEVVSAPPADLADQINQLRTHLQVQPNDSRGWAVLALLLIEQGRVTADPAGYAEADQATTTSLQLMPRGNDLAVAARAALLSAQHHFGSALAQADRALRLNAYSIPALGIRVDALTELGRLPAALRAARHFDSLQPGLSATTRLAYQAELRADDPSARRLFIRSLAEASSPSSRGFVEFHLGEIARRNGNLQVAEGHFDAALKAAPDDPAAMAGRARILALTGRTDRAARILEGVVARVPLLEHLITLGELYELQGDDSAAQQQYDVVRASAELARAAGVRPDLELAWFEADHGDPAEALRLGRAEWRKRHSPLVADALAWALHVNDMDERALHYAKLATAYGGDARSWHHRGSVEAALGMDRAARKHLHLALRLDGGYAPWHAQQLRETLRELEDRS
jgi:tetratricopeptide (TPR) repeat protein